jgi:hypothetical protein
MLTVLSIYKPGWTNFYYLFMPISHGMIVLIKGANLYLGLNKMYDLLTIWSMFVVVVLLMLTFFTKLTKTDHYKLNFNTVKQKGDVLKNEDLDYKEAFN